MPKYSFPVVHYAELQACEFERQFCSKGLPVLCTGVLEQAPWGSCLPYTDFGTLLTHEEVAPLEAEMTVCKNRDVQNPREYTADSLSAEDAAGLLAARHAINEQESASACRDSLYVKVSLTQCEALIKEWRLDDFMSTSPRTAVEHPMLLRPGGYFCWAFVGERGSGSKTHVDVMGSDAWLVVLSGRKKWALCHPADKHLVMDHTGAFADLFQLDTTRFPRASSARIHYFDQLVGDAIFVPSDAPHCVINEEFSVSITFNFMNDSGEGAWKKNMQQVVNASNPIHTVDLVVRHPKTKQQVYIRRFAADLRVAPRNDLDCRCAIAKLQESFKDFRPMRHEELVAARPIGFDQSFPDHRVIYFFSSGDATENFVLWCNRFANTRGFLVEELTDYTPSNLFPQVTSHYGAFPTFPPLCVLFGWKWWFEDAIPLVSLVSQLRANRSGGPSAALGPMSVWHYSRYAWKDGGGETAGSLIKVPLWCRTQLFYCSPCVDGPVSLHPLELDQTLQQDPSFVAGSTVSPAGALESTENSAKPTFVPHFEEFVWDIDALLTLGTPVGLYAFQDDLIKGLATTFYMSEHFFFFEEFVARHGLNYLSSDDLVRCGLEKILAPALWFTSSSGIVGFTYSHTFSAVSEPNTICLSAVPASLFLTRQPNSPAASILSFLCNWITKQKDVLSASDYEIARLEDELARVPASWLDALGQAVRAKSLNDQKIDGDEEMGTADDSNAGSTQGRSQTVLRAIAKQMKVSA